VVEERNVGDEPGAMGEKGEPDVRRMARAERMASGTVGVWRARWTSRRDVGVPVHWTSVQDTYRYPPRGGTGPRAPFKGVLCLTFDERQVRVRGHDDGVWVADEGGDGVAV
jgi:hypothetical protein